MRILNRHKIYIAISLTTVLLWLCVLFICPDQVLIGYSVHNGIADHPIAEKPEAVFRVFGSIPFVIIPWEVLARAINRKIESAPEMSSYKVIRGAIYFVFFLLSSSAGFIAIFNLITNH